MKRLNLPNSLKKHIRKEKARIRREFKTAQEQNERIAKLYETVLANQKKEGSQTTASLPKKNEDHAVAAKQ